MLPIEAAAAAVAISRQLESGYHAPLVWRWPFAGEREEGATARRFVRYLLTGFPAVNDVEQVAGELIANALTHTRSGAPGGRFVVEVRRWPEVAALTVTDQGGPNEPPPGGRSGRRARVRTADGAGACLLVGLVRRHA
ncbi:ATP-binding protein [Actinomadura sp. BRA 177]|uniref:ATP-binding protein n=1 Tax=Actinomadura sp. BRA 177 TaxID=2745202 RepID=UPI0015953E39|nr:ATP-binding protein [Actinomadura sp. BRA 177]NVI85954.1 ATP-binding protein [Actinomadura sp. BRA 177]